jgi:hypothetical protein
MPYVSSSTSAHGQAPARPPKTVTGQRLAKSSTGYPWWARADDAARWLEGEVVVKPTAKLACATFNISYPRLKQAQRRLARLERSKHYDNGNGSVAPALSDDVVQRFVIEIGPDRILHALDRVTSPELPLQAAE